MTEEAIAEACPCCRGNCNCKACLRLKRCVNNLNNSEWRNISHDDRICHAKHLLHVLLPFLKQFNREQLMEKEIEAKVQGLSLAAIKLQKAKTFHKRVCCTYCKTSIVGFHRSCPNCSFRLCLTCSWEIRDGHFLGGGKEVIFQYIDKDDLICMVAMPILFSLERVWFSGVKKIISSRKEGETVGVK
ncbi:hypothetical protein CsSME_00042628 [Camellia sinensis var. sinensis]